MAEESASGLSVPDNTHWAEWNFGQVLLALTGDKIDFGAVDKTWVKFNPDSAGKEFEGEPDGKDAISYHAYYKYYYGANYNHEALRAWRDLCAKMDTIAEHLWSARRGSLDITTIRDARLKLEAYERWLKESGDDYRAWAKNLNSDDSKFKGQAASVIQQRMDTNADALEDLHEQVTDNHGVRIAKTLRDLEDQLNSAAVKMSSAWLRISSEIAGYPEKTAGNSVQNVVDYIRGAGIVAGHPNYQLETIVQTQGWWKTEVGVNAARDYIDKTLAGYAGGNLTNAETWNKMNDEINKQITSKLEELDNVAREVMRNLHPAMLTATTALTELTTPTQSNPSGGGSSFTPPPGGGTDFTPPPGWWDGLYASAWWWDGLYASAWWRPERCFPGWERRRLRARERRGRIRSSTHHGRRSPVRRWTSQQADPARLQRWRVVRPGPGREPVAWVRCAGQSVAWVRPGREPVAGL
ncbi:hypothetical protein [Saccharopolyspora erythraea]|uniref:hypothetical protein n=1 Tax=Saccharopolyspora erythraea TaxID=1836 RepID=UPI0001D312C1|nr:hypothetical protein [Saccharopolyspora erythraea]